MKLLAGKFINNKILLFILSKYATYVIQLINSIFIAVYLGPFYFGVWSYITLIIQYMTQLNFGIIHSVNATISIHKNRDSYVQKIIGNSIIMLGVLCVFFILFFVSNELFNLKIGEKYHFSTYMPIVVIVGCVGYFNTLMSGIFRVYGKINQITIVQSIFPILILCVILIFKGQNLLWSLIFANLLSALISLTLYIFYIPIRIKLTFIIRLIRKIQIKAWHLFIYNSSFYLIVISTRTFVSTYYNVKEFGYFSFSFSLSNAILLLLESLSFLIYPKILNRFANYNNEKTILLLNKLRDTYITFAHLLVHLALLFFPIFIQFIPKYQPAIEAFGLIALTIVIYSNSFGYAGLMIAKGLEKKMGQIALSSLLINLILLFIITTIFKLSFSKIILATMLTYLIYVYWVSKNGRNLLNLKTDFLSIIKDVYPLKTMIPYVLAIIIFLIKSPTIFYIIPVCLFILLNIKTLFSTKKIIKEIIYNQNVTDI